MVGDVIKMPEPSLEDRMWSLIEGRENVDVLDALMLTFINVILAGPHPELTMGQLLLRLAQNFPEGE